MDSTPELLDRLRKIEIFSDFSAKTKKNDQILSNICSIMTLETFDQGEIIINEGDFGDSLHILAEGNVQVMRNTLHEDRFAVVNLSAEHNVFFGEMALINHSQRSASVVALTPCKTFMICGSSYIELCEKEPYFGYKSLYRIGSRLVGSLQRANNDVITLYQALLDEVDSLE